NFFNSLQELINRKWITSLHDVSDGGLFTTLAEFAFTNKVGIKIFLSNGLEDDTSIYKDMFSEETGVVIQFHSDFEGQALEYFKQNNIVHRKCATQMLDSDITIIKNDDVKFQQSVSTLEQTWSETSFAIKANRDNPDSAKQEYDLINSFNKEGLVAKDSFQFSSNLPVINSDIKPKIAIFREQGVNGQNEMAAAFMLAGFEAQDIHMQDILDNPNLLSSFQGIAACGGFSYGDVLGAGGGWSSSISFNPQVRDSFESFFNRPETFTFGVCNGCQMLSNLKDLIPGAEEWPKFLWNESDQFEARLSQVTVGKSSSVLLQGMEGWQIPVAVAHGEGRAKFQDGAMSKLQGNNQIAMQFTNSEGQPTTMYPITPNGSPE
ncbi:MAG: phosphoribosylformylglycinamidine synthase subunit PurQ, partial [SAR86 cluster bacterium]|nr:phosphoribosylformylglycinamidine synthase subunit PurQ [SAR86 cluster bacterium]